MKEEVVCISESKHSKKMLRDSGDKKEFAPANICM